jgi:hypothetical protein
VLDLVLSIAGLCLVVSGAALRAPFVALGAVATFIPALAVPDVETAREVRVAVE